jgi:glycosyltransferase involved in cell wall biosynthesis
MSMGVAPFIPRHVPLVVGTRQIARGEAHRPWVEVIEPPVDVERNCPGAGGALQALVPDLRHEDLLVVVVSRLADALKREGILAAIDAVGALSRDLSIRLLIVGDGPARPEIEAAAAAQNAVAGRPVVTLTGGVMDPRPAYDAADIVLGMGSSALRGMAFAKPLVVQGERGFWRLLEPDSLGEFLEQGWYGIGDGQDGSPALQQILRVLHGDPARRERLGAFSRSVVLDRFSLGAAVERHEAIYAKAVSAAPSRSSVAAGALGPLVHAVAHELRSYVAARRGQPVTEDFNAISAQAGSHRTTQALNK